MSAEFRALRDNRSTGDADGPGEVPHWLIPVVARAARLGRGPGVLAVWVQEMQERAGGPMDPTLLSRLAADLGRCLIRFAGTGTRADKPGHTVRAR